MKEYSNKAAAYTNDVKQKKQNTSVFRLKDNRAQSAFHGSMQNAASQSRDGVIQAFGWESFGKLNPRRYLPEFLGGYTHEQMIENGLAKSMDGTSRLRRAHDRAEARSGPKGPLGKKVDKPTPFGNTGLSRMPFNAFEPQTTSSQADFPGSSSTGAKYADWIPKVGTGNWQEMSTSIDNDTPPANFTMNQRRNAAMISSTMHNSEEYRFGGASKPGRSAVRKIGNGQYLPSQLPDLFPMAQPGGSHSYENHLDQGTPLSPLAMETLEDMSASSDDE